MYWAREGIVCISGTHVRPPLSNQIAKRRLQFFWPIFSVTLRKFPCLGPGDSAISATLGAV